MDAATIRERMATEARLMGQRRSVARMITNLQIGTPERAIPRNEPRRTSVPDLVIVSDAEREGCRISGNREPCFGCGTRADLHDEMGCSRWRGAP
jgi:hypothetical protein